MVLSSEAKNYHSKDYDKLCRNTREGLYVNIVGRTNADKVAQRFFSSMEVYPSDKKLFIREFFGTF